VSQNWAGKNWGLIANPRIGQEVIVEFIEGDPDRPIITGRVYNGEQTVPYALPANATQTGIKTRSSAEGGADNFNEIRFEDKKGEEQVFIHAEKNWDSEVENDQTHAVGHDQKIEVKNDRTKKIGGNQEETVVKNKKITVGENHTEKIDGTQGMTVAKAASWSVGENISIDAKGAGSITIGKDLQESVGANLQYSVADDAKLGIGKSWNIDVGKALGLEVHDAMNQHVVKDWTVAVDGMNKLTITKGYDLSADEILLEATKKITLKTGSASITLESGGDITIKGGTINVKGTGDVIVKGSKIGQN
jgi:type VI secretion system secreted protein VgrG